MIKLLIDTSSHMRTVAVVEDNKLKAFNSELNGTDLSTRMLPMVKDVLNGINIFPQDIDEIYVVNGPGSFTGIRVGVTIAKVYAWSLNKKIVPLSGLELLATTATDADLIVPYIDARRDYAYTAIYDRDLNTFMSPCHISREELLKRIPNGKKVIFVSYDDVDCEYEVVKPEINILKILNKHSNDAGVNPHECNPEYLKMTEAEENLLKKENNND